jgi:hypothetical protein
MDVVFPPIENEWIDSEISNATLLRRLLRNDETRSHRVHLVPNSADRLSSGGVASFSGRPHDRRMVDTSTAGLRDSATPCLGETSGSRYARRIIRSRNRH